MTLLDTDRPVHSPGRCLASRLGDHSDDAQLSDLSSTRGPRRLRCSASKGSWRQLREIALPSLYLNRWLRGAEVKPPSIWIIHIGLMSTGAAETFSLCPWITCTTFQHPQHLRGISIVEKGPPLKNPRRTAIDRGVLI
jgi:hypothetical protein